jgi:hypothetical protein
MVEDCTAEVRMFGRLHTLRRERGLPTTVSVDIPPEGIAAREIAISLDLPLEHIESIFCNHKAHGLDRVIVAGDRMAFVPHGTPGPHRIFLHIRREDEDDSGEDGT